MSRLPTPTLKTAPFGADGVVALPLCALVASGNQEVIIRISVKARQERLSALIFMIRVCLCVAILPYPPSLSQAKKLLSAAARDSIMRHACRLRRSAYGCKRYCLCCDRACGFSGCRRVGTI